MEEIFLASRVDNLVGSEEEAVGKEEAPAVGVDVTRHLLLTWTTPEGGVGSPRGFWWGVAVCQALCSLLLHFLSQCTPYLRFYICVCNYFIED